jgi:hypothetical protein
MELRSVANGTHVPGDGIAGGGGAVVLMMMIPSLQEH